MPVPTWSVGQILASADVNSWFVPLPAYKTSTTVRSTLSLSIDPDLQITLAASAFYEVRAGLIYSAASGGFSFTWTAPAGFGGGYTASFNLSGTGSSTYGYTWAATPLAGTPGGTFGILIEGMLSTAAAAGTFGLNWASGTGPASLTLGIGSYLAARRVG